MGRRFRKVGAGNIADLEKTIEELQETIENLQVRIMELQPFANDRDRTVEAFADKEAELYNEITELRAIINDLDGNKKLNHLMDIEEHTSVDSFYSIETPPNPPMLDLIRYLPPGERDVNWKIHIALGAIAKEYQLWDLHHALMLCVKEKYESLSKKKV